jgi:DNA mismatch endonuclease (patch repair protein)
MDTLTPIERGRRMSLVRSRDTKPEITVRKALHALGYRFRLHRRDLPGRPDVVLPRHRIALFVHGCFWHRHPDPTCKRARLPKTRVDFWETKLTANRNRDLRCQTELRRLGWRVAIVWECELSDIEQLKNRLRGLIEDEACAP